MCAQGTGCPGSAPAGVPRRGAEYHAGPDAWPCAALASSRPEGSSQESGCRQCLKHCAEGAMPISGLGLHVVIPLNSPSTSAGTGQQNELAVHPVRVSATGQPGVLLRRLPARIRGSNGRRCARCRPRPRRSIQRATSARRVPLSRKHPPRRTRCGWPRPCSTSARRREAARQYEACLKGPFASDLRSASVLHGRSPNANAIRWRSITSGAFARSVPTSRPKRSPVDRPLPCRHVATQ